MFDFIKLRIRDVVTLVFEENTSLNFEGTYNKDTGEDGKRFYAEYDNMSITYYPSGFIEIKGSIHKLRNAGKHNFDRFTISDAARQLYEFLLRMEIPYHCAEICNLEYGVNVESPFPAKRVIDCLHLHWGVEPETRYNGRYKQFVHERYLLKVYCKGDQYNQSENLLRVEVKWIKSHDLNNAGVHNLEDLITQKSLEWMMNDLTQKWQDITMYDGTIDNATATQKEQLWISNCSSTNFWSSLPSNHRHRWKSRLQVLSIRYGEDMKGQVRDLIENELNYLYNH